MAEIKLNELHSDNLLAIYDVLLDIEQERQLNPDLIAIPIMRQIIRFKQLMPADSIGLRDKYCESRWKAVKFLERVGVVHDVNPLEGNHRWETHIELQPNSTEFPKFYEAVQTEYSRRAGAKPAGRVEEVMADAATKVFVIHGRDLRLRDGMFTFLRSISLEPIEWIEAVNLTGKSAPYVGEVLDAAFSKAQAVVVMLTGDDEARLRAQFRKVGEPAHETELTPQARPNVLFEAGMAMARNPERTVLVEFGHLRPFSDIGGRHTVRMDNSTEKRQELALRLQKAGCTVSLAGTDWHTAGDLKPTP
ncbi:MAG TPA: nucleotide-binding protein [Candidatus Saccharimonadales bacterium]|nr:nucleotide-binding protein [Candidatus Saccharimonadales bacterium]